MASLSHILACTFAGSVAGHAYLAEPPSRNVVANREQKEYCPHCLQAGGPGEVKAKGGGQWPTREAPQSHGLCGDPVQGSAAPANWRDETYLKPTPVQRTYRPGEVVEFHVGVSTHHRGHYEFRICDQALDGQTMSSRAAGQECLNQWTLERAPLKDSCQANDADPDCQPLDENHPERWYLPPPDQGWQDSDSALPGNAKVHKMRYQIPASLTCSHCTLQWYYSTGNTCLYDGDYFTFFNKMQDLGWPATEWCNFCTPGATCAESCCGAETGKFGEEFWNCADIAVQANGQPGQPEQPDSGTDGQQQPGSDGQQPDQQPGTDGQQPGNDGQQPPSPAQEGCSALWVQCGGIDWAGPTCCQSGSYCHRQSQYYSQCVEGEPGQEQNPGTAAPGPSPTEAPAPSQTQSCSEFCSSQNVTLSGCSTYSSDEASCREGYIVKGGGAIPCVWKSCGCFADGEQWQDCPTLDALCTSLIEHKALRGRRSHQGSLSRGSASGMMFIEAGRSLSRMEDDRSPQEEL